MFIPTFHGKQSSGLHMKRSQSKNTPTFQVPVDTCFGDFLYFLILLTIWTTRNSVVLPVNDDQNLFWHKRKIYYLFSGLIITCMKEIYGRSCAGYTRTRQSKDLDNISANLSGSANPGSRVLLAEMKSRKKWSKFFTNKNLFWVWICGVVAPILSICLRKSPPDCHAHTWRHWHSPACSQGTVLP